MYMAGDALYDYSLTLNRDNFAREQAPIRCVISCILSNADERQRRV